MNFNTRSFRGILLLQPQRVAQAMLSTSLGVATETELLMQPQFITLAPIAKNLTGQRFGRLVALGPVARDRNHHIVWLCQCDCGNETRVTLQELRAGKTKSCGCIRREGVRLWNKTHGMTRTKIHNTWLRMKQRCTVPSAKDYIYYGERGILVCDGWLHSFEAFHAYVSQLCNFGEVGYSLDRIDNDGNYEPGNVQWATQTQQMQNTRRNHLFEYNGETLCLTEWARRAGISEKTFRSRLRYGWNIERILTTRTRKLTKRIK